jgi:spore coat polysaccharide biosynthesis predicted glycosyltransferase SpsG
MRFIFRADASREIGSGHVMRSSVLAEEAISRGYECIFVGEISDLNWVSDRIANMGFSRVISCEKSFDADVNSDVLILDSYTIPVSNSFVLKKNWKLVLSICDEISPKYEADIELHPGLETAIRGRAAPIILSGAPYILIRNGIKKSHRVFSSGRKTKVLIVGGGSDPFGFVQEISIVIDKLDLNLEVHAFSDEVSPKIKRHNYVSHPIGPVLDSIAGDFDLVLTTASTTSLEFIAREIPMGVVCAVNNQANYYGQLGRLGLATQIGVRNESGDWDFDIRAIRELLVSMEKRRLLKVAINGLVDSDGATRVIDYLASYIKDL